MAYTATIPDNYRSDSFPIAKGVKLKGNTVFFDSTFSEKQVNEILYSYWSKVTPKGKDGEQFIAKKLKGETGKALTRQDVEMSGVEVPAQFTDEEYNFFRLSQANTRLDRAGDVLTKNFLDRLAKGVNDEGGISLLYNHDHMIALGKIFHEQVQKMTTGADDFELIGYAAINKKASMPNHPNMSVKEGIDAGMLNWVSIGFRAVGEVKQAGDKFYQEFDYKEGQAFTPEHFETSLVYFPAQYGAKIKNYNGNEEEFDAVKLFNFKKLHKKNFISAMEIKANGKTFTATPEVSEKEGTTTATIKGLEGLQDEIKALEAANEQLKAVKAILLETNQETINDIQNLEGEKALNKSFKHSKEELEAMLISSPAKFKALATDLRKEHEEGIKAGRIVAPAGREREVVKSVDNLW